MRHACLIKESKASSGDNGGHTGDKEARCVSRYIVARERHRGTEILNEGCEKIRVAPPAVHDSVRRKRDDVKQRVNVFARGHASTRTHTFALLDTLGPPRTNSAIPSARTHDYDALGHQSIERHASFLLRYFFALRSYLQIRLQKQDSYQYKMYWRFPAAILLCFTIRTRRPRRTREQEVPSQ